MKPLEQVREAQRPQDARGAVDLARANEDIAVDIAAAAVRIEPPCDRRPFQQDRLAASASHCVDSLGANPVTAQGARGAQQRRMRCRSMLHARPSCLATTLRGPYSAIVAVLLL